MKQSACKTALAILIVSACTALFAEESAVAPTKNNRIFVSLAPMIMVNTDDTTHSAPSPIMFSGGIGATLFQQAPISFEPRLSFFTNYYLWDGAAAHPAEIENRTAYAPSFLLDMDAVKIFRIQKHRFQVGAGISLLARLFVLASGVSSNDAGGTDTSTASDDVSSIRDYFWSDLRFLYANLTFCWLYDLPNGWQAGVGTNISLPLGSLTNGDGIDGMLGSLSFRLAF